MLRIFVILRSIIARNLFTGNLGGFILLRFQSFHYCNRYIHFHISLKFEILFLFHGCCLLMLNDHFAVFISSVLSWDSFRLLPIQDTLAYFPQQGLFIDCCSPLIQSLRVILILKRFLLANYSCMEQEFYVLSFFAF